MQGRGSPPPAHRPTHEPTRGGGREGHPYGTGHDRRPSRAPPRKNQDCLRGIYSHNGVMKNARISELRDGLSEYLARVRKGETVIVFDRDTPIARIEPIPPGHALPEWLREAERLGVVRPPRVRHPAKIPLPPPKPSKPARVLEALL